MSAAVLDEPKVESVKVTRIDSMITYPVNKAEIATLRAKFEGLSADTPKGYEQVRLAIGQCRELRVKIDKRRKELKADSLEFGRKVDSVAKLLTAEIESIENPLQLAKDEIDDAKAREKLKKEQEEKAKLEAEVKAEREAEELRLKAIRDAEDARLAQERAKLEAERKEMEAKQKAIDEANRIERERIAAEQKKSAEEARLKQEKIDCEITEKQRIADEANHVAREKIEAAQKAIEEERRAVAEAKQKAEREEFERKTRLQAEEDARVKAELDRAYAEKEAERKRVAEAAEKARLEAIKPDIQKVHDFADQLNLLYAPQVSSKEAKSWLVRAMQQIKAVADELKTFDGQDDEIPY